MAAIEYLRAAGPLVRDGPLYGCMTARTTGICPIKLNLITEEYHV